MSFEALIEHANRSDELSALASAAADEPQRAFCSASLRPFVIACLLGSEQLGGGDAVVIAPDDRAARDLTLDLRAYLPGHAVRFFASRGVGYESQLAPPPHLVGLRIAALEQLADHGQGGGRLSAEGPGPPAIVVASAVALMERMPDPELRPHGFSLAAGEQIDLDATLERLVACGYERVDQVADRGEFSARGGILDIYPSTEERAARVELFGDEIDSLRWFSTFTQRSLGEASRVEIAPAAELDPEYRELAEMAAREPADRRPDIAELLPVDRFRSLIELIPETATLVLAAEEELGPALADHWQDVTTSLHSDDADQLYLSPSDVVNALDSRISVRLSAVAGDQPHQLRAQAADAAAKSIKDAEPELEKLVRSGYLTVVAWSSSGEAQRAAYNLARLRPTDIDTWQGEPQLVFAHAALRRGFIAPQLELAVIPDHRLLRRRRADRGRGERTRALRAFSDLRPGDIVVHSDHGIARFTGFDTKTVAEVTRDYLELEYRDGDRVFVPTDQLEKLSRYVGADGSAPTLSKLGSKTWDNMKARARRAAVELAGELLNVYAERKRRKGHGFGPDSDWQLDFERAFPYRETDDQLDAIEQTKADMESGQSMDRLICGDVGYGKTEVALRAAFKAAGDGRQTMLLAPTTILAQQHFGTFSERLHDYPFNIELLSRFRSAKRQREIVRDFAQGKVDILIGTHRLLSRDIQPKDLGLVIVDEEQRFGVKQKEILRQLRLRVDVLALSATPIPRTLQMSLAGLRDISVIETPPEGRRPIHTYVGEHDDDLIRGAIERELERKGQTFLLHDLVETIDEAAERVKALCPRANVAVAHGQMDASALEQAMLDFLQGRTDVLVSTTIIESGLDIPQANTLIVMRADKLGLAQLYQIRGRVGRSRERAYAYLLYPSAEALTHEQATRLATLSDYTELGSGFKIAMRDLELRGAGSLLGTEQSGHVAAIGFELYCQLLDDAVRLAELAGEGDDAEQVAQSAASEEPVRLDIPVDAYVPETYIPYEVAKIDAHRRVAAARTAAELEGLRAELADRFGPLPQPVENLVALQGVRVNLGAAGARTAELRGEKLAIGPLDLDSKQVAELRGRLEGAIYESASRTLRIRAGEDPSQRLSTARAVADALEQLAGRGQARDQLSAEGPEFA
ncbi:MAG: transcription-repair coupling factor [Solirubrobacterales bacterium]